MLLCDVTLCCDVMLLHDMMSCYMNLLCDVICYVMLCLPHDSSAMEEIRFDYITIRSLNHLQRIHLSADAVQRVPAPSKSGVPSCCVRRAARQRIPPYKTMSA